MTREIVHYRGRYLDLIERENWEFASRNNASNVVVIVAVTPEEEIVLIEQFRRPVESVVIELPAGLVGDNHEPDETVLQAALRELEEETGYAATRLDPIMACPSSAGMTDEFVSFVKATGLARVGPGGGDASEDILVHTVAMESVDDWLLQQQDRGKLLDPKIYAALYWLRRPDSTRTPPE
jgi:ADP-ribose pyrophosphatase